MHIINWLAAQKEDSELEATLKWLLGQKKDDWKALLAKHAMEEEGQILFHQHHWLTSKRGVLYLKSLGEDGVKELSLFVAPRCIE